MNNNFPNRDVVEELRKEYPKGTVVILDKMIDAQAPEIGTAEEVLSVDDIGTVHITWLSGGTLGAAYMVRMKYIKRMLMKRLCTEYAKRLIGRSHFPMPPVSVHAVAKRWMEYLVTHYPERADIIICDECGVKESIEDAVASGVMKGNEPLPIEEWAVAKGAYHIYAEDDENGWKLRIPETGAEGYCEKPEDIVSTGERLKAGESCTDEHTIERDNSMYRLSGTHTCRGCGKADIRQSED